MTQLSTVPEGATMSATRRRRLEIRRAILDAAIGEFARNGLAGTSTQAIAAAAGLTKAQLHYYITSKEELYEEALQFIVGEWKDIFFFSTSSSDPAEVICSYIDRKMRHALEHPEVSRLFASEVARGASVLSQHWGELKAAVDEASAVIRSWIDAGLIRPVDPVLFQMNMWAVTQHYAEYEAQVRTLLETPEGEALDADRIIREATELVLARCGLARPQADRGTA
ncbi:TetR/AcrR family transcriptional regulator [Aquibium sp. A9E412]|uniref:TetR/AcrR family transcriptional regulator n=1 Tax=Aquibium sp. A9E412 TaxID=2976767 RepID=UPI0025B20E29|nr:TetR/AcrR family transcriptional regulator [Aquibium sp. A9E412]MDN2564598.1 TetR/AcrR family transcriptional regulator [Aquibium sp. A9E412]